MTSTVPRFHGSTFHVSGPKGLRGRDRCHYSLARAAIYLTMSNQQKGNCVDPEPLSKKQKRGGGDEKPKAAEITAFGGPMYDEATARRMLREVVLNSTDDAPGFGRRELFNSTEDGEPVIGFDPDDAALNNIYYHVVEDAVEATTPLIYFAEKGDAKMCRYLVSRGASTTKSTSTRPMYLAALEGHLGVCKFLQANGASHDIWRENATYGWTPFHTAAFHGHDEVVRWLVLQGALCANGNSESLDEGVRIYPKNYRGNGIKDWRRPTRSLISRQCERLVAWAEEVAQSHSAVVMFLLGTLPPPPDKEQSCILQSFSGHPGVLKHIGDFVGLEVTKGKHLRILQNVVDVLPSFIKD